MVCAVRWTKRFGSYGNNVANLGSVQNTPPGRYLIRRGTTPGLQLLDGISSDGAYRGYITLPTTYGCVLGRILPFSYDSDLATVHQIQSELKVLEVKRANFYGPNLTAILGQNLTGSSVAQQLQTLALMAPWNPPEIKTDIKMVDQTLATAGMEYGLYSQPSGVNETAAELGLNITLATSLLQPGITKNLSNDWSLSYPAGNFLSYYGVRAIIARTGYLELTADQALYPAYNLSQQASSLSLEKNQSYVYTFSKKPPVTGFWSLTAYGTNQLFIPNSRNVYALGDRSNMTYADGTLVYGNSARDGTFQIMVQAADVKPPANWTSNWLPAPAGGGLFSATCKFMTIRLIAFTDSSQYIGTDLRTH